MHLNAIVQHHAHAVCIINALYTMGWCKSWSLDSGLDYGLIFGLGFGVKGRWMTTFSMYLGEESFDQDCQWTRNIAVTVLYTV